MDASEMMERLNQPFDPREVKWKPQSVKGNRALAVAYVDVRTVTTRLDDVFGVAGWQDSYDVLPNDSVMCRLAIWVDGLPEGRWVTKQDVGSPSEQPDGGDRMKAAVSDALKRCAVKLGVGKYLYRLPIIWAEYDPQKRQFVSVPQLPHWALPKGKGQQTTPQQGQSHRPSPPASPPVGQQARSPQDHAGPPTSGAELHARLRDADARMAAANLCPAGALLTHVARSGVKAGYSDDIARWNGSDAIQFAISVVRAFEKEVRDGKSSEQPSGGGQFANNSTAKPAPVADTRPTAERQAETYEEFLQQLTAATSPTEVWSISGAVADLMKARPDAMTPGQVQKLRDQKAEVLEFFERRDDGGGPGDEGAED